MNEFSQHRLQAICQLLTQARAASGCSLRELARRAGTSHATLLAYENGRKVPSAVVFLRILEACNLAVDFELSPRIREWDGIARGDELVDALLVAEQFPAKLSKNLELPCFGGKGRATEDSGKRSGVSGKVKGWPT